MGQLSSSSDLDAYSIVVSSAGTVTLDFDAPTNSSYSDYFGVTLFDSGGNVLASQSTGQDTSFSAGIGSAGTYYAVVDAPSYYHDSGQYGLTVTTGGSVGSSETEDNGSVSSADVLSSGAQIMGQLSSSSDVDYYSIVASSAGTVTLDFDAPTNSSYTDISG